MEKGSYTFILELPEDIVLEVGALGEIGFENGFYAYNGSANGPGGFKRLERHVSGPENIHWHIDRLTSHSTTRPVMAAESVDADIECALSRELEFDAVPGFGCSDCGCDSHLFHLQNLERVEKAVRKAHRENGGEVQVERF